MGKFAQFATRIGDARSVYRVQFINFLCQLSPIAGFLEKFRSSTHQRSRAALALRHSATPADHSTYSRITSKRTQLNLSQGSDFAQYAPLPNTAKSDHDFVVEVDPYFVWPGQAIAYKIGQLKIRELRNYAETKLGVGFDERAYHDDILASGTAMPTAILKPVIILANSGLFYCFRADGRLLA